MTNGYKGLTQIIVDLQTLKEKALPSSMKDFDGYKANFEKELENDRRERKTLIDELKREKSLNAQIKKIESEKAEVEKGRKREEKLQVKQ